MNRSELVLVDTGSSEMSANGNVDDRDDSSSDLEAKEGESDYEPAMDSLLSQGDSQNSEDNKVKRASRVPKSLTMQPSADSCPRASRGTTYKRESNKLQFKSPNNGQKRSQNSNKVGLKPKNLSQDDLETDKVPPKPSSETSSELSEGTDERTAEDFKEIGVLDEAPNCYPSVGTDDETVDAEKNNGGSDMAGAYLQIGEMELKIEKLEEELREVAALEISLYSVVPEHGSSAHKVHTSARRLSRLYIYACKHWSPNKRATVAKNTASGLVLVAKSCGNDVPRLTFWLSNIVVLRQLISQTFGNHHTNPMLRVAESNGSSKKRENPSPVKWKNSNISKQSNGLSLTQLADDWEETGTFTAALQRIESWIFSRIVESVWWQTLTPCMQTPLENFYLSKVFGKLSRQDLDDQQQGNLSLELWRSAFHDAFTRLCPVRAGGHECGCVPVLARLVMEQCISRLDVAMFNAILRESANEIPTDPVSDPIVDPQVLPIPSGDLSFGSGAQLKNSIGNWSRWLTDLFGVDTEDSIKDDQPNDEDDHRRGGESYSKFFLLLNELGDLLMLPKDMLLDKTIRKEVCPSVGLHLITRILCNFVPDEFCSDHVPGVVLEELKYESSLERRSIDKELINSFPCTASPVVYSPPSPSDVAQKVADGNGKAELNRRASIIQRKGYTSDEDLEDLDSPLTAIIDKTPVSSPSFGSKILKETAQANARYRLLQEIWSE